MLNLKDHIKNLVVGEMITKYIKKRQTLFFKFEITEVDVDYIINKEFISEIDETDVEVFLSTK